MDKSQSHLREQRDLPAIRERLRHPDIWPGWANALDRESLRASFATLLHSMFHPWNEPVKHWGFKEIRYGPDDGVLKMLADALPDARFVFVARHPVSTLASAKIFRSSPLAELIEGWDTRYRYYNEFMATHSDRCTLVRCEDLLSGEGVDIFLESLGLVCTDRQREVLTLKDGRYASPVRSQGIDPIYKLNPDQLRSIYCGTTKSRKLLGYGIEGLLRRHDDVSTCKLQDEDRYVVIRDGIGSFFTDTVGAAILTLCDGTLSRHQASVKLHDLFDNVPENIDDEVNSTLETLVRYRLVEVLPISGNPISH